MKELKLHETIRFLRQIFKSDILSIKTFTVLIVDSLVMLKAVLANDNNKPINTKSVV